MQDEIMDIRNAAKYLQIKERTLYRLVGEGEIPGIKVGGQWRFSKKCLEDLFSTTNSHGNDKEKASHIN